MEKKKTEDFLNLYNRINDELKKVVQGQEEVIKFVVIALLTDGHILLEGLPGLGKTLIANCLSRIIGASFKRIQFTPDLMPSDILGTTVFNFEKNDFVVRKGPIFTNFLLSDEINRTPAKTQSALLEVMQEKQVTIDGVIYKLDEPFITIATQNPIELEGTYPLPEAQLDRFMFKILVKYPAVEDEKNMLKMFRDGFDSGNLQNSDLQIVCGKDDFVSYKNSLDSVNIDEKILDYIMDIVSVTRKTPGIEVGASPRASIALLKASRALAAISGRDFVVPDDVKEACYPVLRHRIILESEAEIEGNSTDDFITICLGKVAVPR
ncbi:MAG: magnesium chelatase [Spirochaetes bacterium GWD1_27_9]|nr:MAG: magnesium chelatase [Spirochaetes bacterium GWB1_27_13]OHD21187.1 MAG: magnesium chelatase [Spirochaetes bacterium GWC1_27_15]OHD38910.1 MAG: magnesium chelatase [Spirochaetes bacterium GWD1_27_9]